MNDGIRLRILKLLKRKAITEEQLKEVKDLLKANELEINDLAEMLLLRIGDGARPTYLVGTWKETIGKVQRLLSLAPEEAVQLLLLIDKGGADDVI